MAGLGGMLGRRIAASEGGYFSNRSREAIANLKEKVAAQAEATAASTQGTTVTAEANADVLPEILRHSVPKGFGDNIPTESSLKAPTLLKAMKSIKRPAVPSKNTTQIQSETSLTFERRKWQMEPHDITLPPPSTANDARTDLPGMSTVTAKTIIDGYLMITKAFVIASTVVFGGAIVGVALLKKYLDLKSLEDIPVKAREVVQPKADGLQRVLEPARSKAQSIRNRWHLGDPRDGSLRSELAENFKNKTR